MKMSADLLAKLKGKDSPIYLILQNLKFGLI